MRRRASLSGGHSIVKAEGPERIVGEWWRNDEEMGMQRDYYRVEIAQGCFAMRGPHGISEA